MCDVGLPPVYNCKEIGATFSGHRHGSIGIGCGPGLRDRNDQSVLQSFFKEKTA